MSNGNTGGGSVWPVITIIVGVIALALAGWDAVLSGHNRALERRVEKLEGRLAEIDTKTKATEATTAAARRKARAAAAAAGSENGEQKPAPAATGDKATAPK